MEVSTRGFSNCVPPPAACQAAGVEHAVRVYTEKEGRGFPLISSMGESFLRKPCVR